MRKENRKCTACSIYGNRTSCRMRRCRRFRLIGRRRFRQRRKRSRFHFTRQRPERMIRFWESFRKDDVFCEKYGIRCLRREYEGAHTWNVWRKCIKDFLQLLFRQVDG